MQLLRELFGLSTRSRRSAGRGGRPPRSAQLRRALMRIGTRGSALALAQARWVADRARRRARSSRSRTSGDAGARRDRRQVALGRHDRGGAAWPARSTWRCTRPRTCPGELADGPRDRGRAAARGPARRARSARRCRGARVGTSSLRRRAQLLAGATDLEVVELRGNVDTRLRKLAAGEVDALVLAAAGPRAARAVTRSGRARRARVFVPAAGPGRLALEARDGDERARRGRAIARRRRRWRCLRAERARRARCSAPTATRRSGVPRGRARAMRGFVGAAGRLGVGARRARRAPTARRWRGAARRCSPPGARGASLSGVTVYLVGAGPGRPRAADRARARADRARRRDPLRPPDPRRRRSTARARTPSCVYVGKQGGGAAGAAGGDRPAAASSTARPGERVVRLKGGDPFVFGRGGEEALVLREAGIDVRGRARASPPASPRPPTPASRSPTATLASARRVRHRPRGPGEAEPTLDWAALARFPGTLVFYMGVRALPRIAERLIAGGRRRDEPVAVVERGTLPGQRTLVATLADVAERAAEAERSARPRSRRRPGGGAARASSRWLERRPLHGRTVAVTRARAQARPLAARLRELGADVVEAPAIRTQLARGRRPDLDGYDLARRHEPQRRRTSCSRASPSPAATRARSPACASRRSGPGTARALREHGIVADVVPERAVAEGLVEALAGVPRRRACSSCARARARDVLPDALRERGAEVDRAGALRDGAPSRSTPRARAAAARRLRHLHLGLDRALPRRRPAADAAGGPAARLDRPGDERRRCASTASSPTSRPTRTRPTGSSRRSSPRATRLSVRGDGAPDHVPVGLRAARRVRRRRPRRDRADRPEARVIDLAHGVPRHGVLAGRADAGAGAAATRRRACTSRSSTPRSARGGARSRCGPPRRTGCWSGPTTGC